MEKKTKKGIKNAAVFLVVGTQSYFDDIPKDEVMYAKGLNKPFRVLVDEGVKVPDWFKEGVSDYKQEVVSITNLVNNKTNFDFLGFLE